MALNQEGFRFYADGSESGSTALAAQDTAVTVGRTATTQLRVLLDSTGDEPSTQYQLEYKLSTDGAYTVVPLQPGGAPTFVVAGTIGESTGTLTPNMPAHVTNDILLLIIESAGGEAATLTTANGFVAVTGSPSATGATTSGTRMTAFWVRATSAAMSAPLLADPGNHVTAQILVFRGCVTSGNPWDVTAAAQKASASTSASSPGLTTTVDRTLVVSLIARDTDSAAAAFSAPANASLTGVTELAGTDGGTALGTGGGFVAIAGVKETAGVVSATTATVASSINASLTIALKGLTAYPISMAASASIAASGANTTFRLSPPGAKATSDFVAGRIADDENPLDAVNITADDYTEVVWSIQATSFAVSGAAYNFRVTKAGTALDTYAVTPTLDVGGLNRTSRGSWISGTAFGTGAYTAGSSFTPTANSLVVITALALVNAGAVDPSADLTLSGGSLTWTPIANVGNATSWSIGLRSWYAAVGSSPPSITPVVDCGAHNIYHYMVVAADYTNAAASPIGATGTNGSVGVNGAGSLTLGATPLQTSTVLSVLGRDFSSNGVSSAGVTPGDGWTELWDLITSDGNNGLHLQGREGTTSTTVAWADIEAGTSTVAKSAGLAFELKWNAPTGSVGNAEAAATANAVGTGERPAVGGDATGVATAPGVGTGVRPAVGEAAGSSTAPGVGDYTGTSGSTASLTATLQNLRTGSENLVKNADNLNHVNWTGYFEMPVRTGGKTAPDGSSTAWELGALDSVFGPGGTYYSGFLQNYDPPTDNAYPAQSIRDSGNSYYVSFWGRTVSGTFNVSYGLDDNATTSATLTTTWQQFGHVFSNVASGNNRIFQILENVQNSPAWQVWKPVVRVGPFENVASANVTLANLTLAAAATSPTTEQEGFAYYGDGTEAASPLLLTQDVASIRIPFGIPFLLRMLINAPPFGSTPQYRLEYKRTQDSVYGAVPLVDAVAQPVPTFVLAGTGVESISTAAPTWPAHISGDIALLLVESTGGQAATLSTPAGFAAVTGSPSSTGNTTAGTRITAFWCRATSGAMGAPTVADPGDHVWAQILTFRGCIASGNPWNVTAATQKAGASTSASAPAVVTTAENCLIVNIIARDNDLAAAAFSNWTNASLAGLTECAGADAGTALGNGGGFGVAVGTKATTGSTGSTTATVTSSINASLTIALLPPAPVPNRLRLTPSASIAAGAVTATTARLAAPAGKTTADFIAGRISDDTNPLPALTIPSADDYTELVWSLRTKTPTIDGDSFNFRVTNNGAVLTYLVTPEMTVGSSGVGAAEGVATALGVGRAERIAVGQAAAAAISSAVGTFTQDIEVVAYLSGGAANASAAASIGGAKSSVVASGDLIGPLTREQFESGVSIYRCLYLQASSTGDIRTYVQSDTPASDTVISVGWGAAAINQTETAVANELTSPAGVTFSSPVSLVDAPSGGTFAAGNYRALWIKYQASAAAVPRTFEPFTLNADRATETFYILTEASEVLVDGTDRITQ